MNENAKQPTQQEIDEFWKEVQQDEEMKHPPVITISEHGWMANYLTFKCKPTYNFQSIEFEVKCRTMDELPVVIDIYQAVLNELIRIAPEQPAKTVAPAAELATAKQREILDKFHLKYKSNITKQEAQELIKQSIEAVSK